MHFCYRIIIWPTLASLTIPYFNYLIYKTVSNFMMFTIISVLILIIIYFIVIGVLFKMTILSLYYAIENKSNSLIINVFYLCIYVIYEYSLCHLPLNHCTRITFILCQAHRTNTFIGHSCSASTTVGLFFK